MGNNEKLFNDYICQTKRFIEEFCSILFELFYEVRQKYKSDLIFCGILRTLIYFPDSLNTKRKSSKFLTFYFFFTFSFLKHIYKTISMRKRVKISLHENFLFFLIFFNIFCSLFSRSAIGFPTQWRHAALVGRQAYRLRLRPGRRPRRSRDACTASDVILYTALKASPNYIKLTYSTDSIFFYWFFFLIF